MSARRDRRKVRGSRWSIALFGLAVALGVGLVVTLAHHRQVRRRTLARPPAATVTVLRTPVSRPVSPGFVGVSIESRLLSAYTGSDPRHVNPVLERLIRNLAPGQRPVLRLGGISADQSWIPVRGTARPGGVVYTLTPRRIAVIRALVRATHARLTFGLDLEAGQRIAVAEGRALAAGLGPRAIESFELGNEPLRYRLFAWYTTAAGTRVMARSRRWGFPDFNREFAAVARQLPHRIGVAGPAQGGARWMGALDQFIGAQPRLNQVTFHTYPLSRCRMKDPNLPIYPSVPHLLSLTASRGRDPQLARYIGVAHRFGRPFRLDETNSVSCGGKARVSNSFASALWAVDWLFGLVRIGASGADFHTFQHTWYSAFDFARRHGRWHTSVRPLYYGMLLFARAAPAGARLLRVRLGGTTSVRAWATRVPNGTIRVMLINDDLTRSHLAFVSAPVGSSRASILRLTAPSAYSLTGVRLGGRTFAGVTDGVLPRPRTEHVARQPTGRYAVSVPAASAALLTLPPSPIAG